jgi:hypothetical protein
VRWLRWQSPACHGFALLKSGALIHSKAMLSPLGQYDLLT